MGEHTKELAALKTKLDFYVANGRTDSAAANAIRARMNALAALDEEHADTVARERREYDERQRIAAEGRGRWASGVGDARTVRETYGKL